MKKHTFYNFTKYVFFILCFIGIPTALLFTGYYYTRQQNIKNFEKDLFREINAFYTRFDTIEDPQKFWYYLFYNNIVLKSKKSKKLQETIQNIVNDFKDLKKDYDFDYIVYHSEYGGVVNIASDTVGGSIADLKRSLNIVYNYYYHSNINVVKNKDEEELLGRVFGPQFFIGHLYVSEHSKKGVGLCWTDSLYKRRLIWCSRVNGCLAMAFLKPKYLNDLSCLAKYLENSEKEMSYDFSFSIKNTDTNTFIHSSNKTNHIDEVKKASLIYEKDGLLEIKTNNYYIYPKFLRPGVTVYSFFDKSKIKNIEPSWIWKIGIILDLFVGLFLIIYYWRIIFLHKLDSISIKWKLGFLFFFANGLPLLVLIFIGNDFLKQARNDYIQKKINEGTAFLQDFDEKYELEFARAIIRKEKLKRSILEDKNKNKLNSNDADKFYNTISSSTWALFLIASQGQTIIRNGDGIFDENDLKKNPDGSYKGEAKYNSVNSNKFEKHLSGQIELSQKIGFYLLNKFNNKTIDEKSATEIEFALEATLRRNPEEFVFSIISRLGSFMSMGFGQNVYPALIDTIRLNGKDYDYLLWATIRTRFFQLDYLTKVIPLANRNEIGLKVVSWNNENGYIPYERSQALDDFRKRLSPYPIKEPIIVRHNKVDYIAMGFDCKHIEYSKLIGLYPLDLVEEHVALKRKDLILFSSLSLIVTLILSSIIIRSFLVPLSAIYDGAKAIEQKNFQHQLPKLGRDEFGAMGKIFNEVIVDLEELSVAGAIQEQLLPNSEIKTGYFSLYGKSVAMGALGGDYFDFIEMEDNKFSVALGDVAGHGVGASLIMAMAKAGLISLDSLWKTPKSLIEKLHDMVYKSKTHNQRKIMTFQYMYLNGETGEAIYSNAGGCSPFIVRKSTGMVEELKLSGAVLGAFKKGKFSETSIRFDIGDAIVFYTDGVVECKDRNGIVLGYENLKKIFLKCWNKDAQKYYNNIYDSYLEYIGGSKAEDDVTLVILVFNKPLVIGNESDKNS